MTPDQVLGVVRDAVTTVLEVDAAAVTLATRFAEDLSADSLALVEIVEITEQRLQAEASGGFRFDDDDLDDLLTVGDAVSYVLARL